MIKVRLIIKGKVQGVFYRALTVEKAGQIGGITGWVANNADGTVSIVAEGPENKVNDLVDWCNSGPSTCLVEKIEIEKLTFTGEFNDFSIRY